MISTLATNATRHYLFPALAILCGLGGLALCHFGLRLFRKRRGFLGLRSSEIGSAVAGTVELHGLAQGKNTICSAITAQPCYYYRAAAWQEGKNHAWQKVAEETELIPFCLDDLTGHVQVNPHGADMDLLRDFYEEYGRATLQTQTDLPQSVTAFLARHNVSNEKAVRIEEYKISPQSPLFVAGALVASQRGETPVLATAEVAHGEVIRLSPQGAVASATGMSMQSRVAAALSRAGVQNPCAWETAIPVAAAEARSQSAAERGGRTPKVAIGKGAADSTFVISWRSRRELAIGLARPAIILVLGSMLLFASLYLLTSFGWR